MTNMTKEEQIAEMARDIFEPRVAVDGIDIAFAAVHGADRDAEGHFMRIARHLYEKGYRKHSVGEWIDTGDFELDNIYSGWKCSLCGHIFCGNKTNFCSNCGAKMKGEQQ